MLRLIPRNLHHAHQNLPTRRTLIAKKSRSIQLGPSVPSNRRSYSTPLSFMDEIPSYDFKRTGTLDDAIARSKNSSDIQKSVLELPDVARIPSRKRTFHLKHEDLETHVRPLLSYNWHVGRIGDVVDDLQVFSLNKLFSFKDFRTAVDFFDALSEIQNEEDHHARVTVDYSNVYVSTHTHVAHQPTSADVKTIKVAGLTARDIRFAGAVERLHERFLGDERAVTKVPTDSATLQAWSMEQLRRRYPPLRG